MIKKIKYNNNNINNNILIKIKHYNNYFLNIQQHQ